MIPIRTRDLNSVTITSVTLIKTGDKDDYWFEMKLTTANSEPLQLMHVQFKEPRKFRDPRKAYEYIEKHMPLIKEVNTILKIS